jgi:voltage-gated potassium channel
MTDRTRRLQWAVASLVGVILLAAAWYALVEGFSPLDALFMSVTTITTVGYGEVRPLDTSGRVFTMCYILVGVGLAFYTVVALVEALVVGEFADALGLRRLNRRVRRMEDHYVLCGFGRVGREIARELHGRGLEFVLIDRDPARQQRARELGYLCVQGDATEESVLKEAGVDRARVLITAADSDAGNTFVTLTARALNPRVLIIARAASDAGGLRMEAAGADRVISPYQMAGRRMALAAVRPSLVDFVDALNEHRTAAASMLAELVIGEDAQGLAGKQLRESMDGLSTQVLGLERDGQVIVGPARETVLRAGDRLMLYGAQHEIEALCGDGGAWTPGATTAARAD